MHAHKVSAHGARSGAAHVLAALQAPHQVEAAVRKGLLQRVGHLEAHALGQALLRRQRVGALRLPGGPGGMVQVDVHQLTAEQLACWQLALKRKQATPRLLDGRSSSSP